MLRTGKIIVDVFHDTFLGDSLLLPDLLLFLRVAKVSDDETGVGPEGRTEYVLKDFNCVDNALL